MRKYSWKQTLRVLHLWHKRNMWALKNKLTFVYKFVTNLDYLII